MFFFWTGCTRFTSFVLTVLPFVCVCLCLQYISLLTMRAWASSWYETEWYLLDTLMTFYATHTTPASPHGQLEIYLCNWNQFMLRILRKQKVKLQRKERQFYFFSVACQFGKDISYNIVQMLPTNKENYLFYFKIWGTILFSVGVHRQINWQTIKLKEKVCLEFSKIRL